jgi:hypothetical protein
MLSHQHKTVFVHIPKNAGQSIETVFLDVLGLTWESRAPLLLRPNDIPELGPRRLAHLAASEYVSCGHMTQEQFDGYYKFAFVRNPWDRVVSLWKYTGLAKEIDLKTFAMVHVDALVASGRPWLVKTQTDYLYDEDGTLLVDFVGKFETLSDDFAKVAETLGLPATSLPHVNASRAPGGEPKRLRRLLRATGVAARSLDSPHYNMLFDAESREYVAEVYSDDIRNFGYSF